MINKSIENLKTIFATFKMIKKTMTKDEMRANQDINLLQL